MPTIRKKNFVSHHWGNSVFINWHTQHIQKEPWKCDIPSAFPKCFIYKHCLVCAVGRIWPRKIYVFGQVTDSGASDYRHISMFFTNVLSEENRNKFHAQVPLIMSPTIPVCLWLKLFPGDEGFSVLNPGHILENWDVSYGRLNFKIILMTWYIYPLWFPPPWAWAGTVNGISLSWVGY